MELPESRTLIRDLDLTLQPRNAPRYKVWLPLATQQLRLRNLIQVIGYNLKADNIRGKECFYYTLHHANMSSPLYTSEPIDDSSPKWMSLEVPVLYATGHSSASEVVLRIWKRAVRKELTEDTLVMAWNLSLTGLVYLGTKLPANLGEILLDGSLIFHLYGGFFVPPRCCINMPDLKRYLNMNVMAVDAKDSYTVNKLSSLRSKMQALKQQSEAARALRERIALGYQPDFQIHPHSTLNRLLCPARPNYEKKAESLKIRKELEVARFRAKLLDQERIRKIGEIRLLSQLHANIVEENQDHGSDLMGRYRELNKEIERLREWRQEHMETREVYIRTTSRLACRRKQLISELSLIYPISRMESGKYTINNVHLPDSEELDSCNDTQVAVALGSVAHTTQMIANFLNIPTRYPIIHCASRSKVIDHITENIPDKDRQFPLFARGKDKLQFRYAVYLLNKNIAQLRWYCGLPTVDLRATLPNLASLMNMKPAPSFESARRTFSGSSLDTEYNTSKKPPSISPFEKVVFKKCHGPLHSKNGASRGARSSLGASLDQGLDNDSRSPILSNKTRRLCKSEEYAINSRPSPFINDQIKPLNYEVHESSTDQTCVASVENGTARVIPMETNIEITVPVSVVQPSGEFPLQDTLANGRHRSSNSVSSCEIALCASHADGDDVWMGDVPNYEDTVEETFASDETLQLHQRDIDEPDSGHRRYESKSLNYESTEYSDDQKLTLPSNEPANKTHCDKSDTKPSKKSSAFNETMSMESCSSMNDAIEYASRIMERKQRTSSVCSFPEEYMIPERLPQRKRYDSESKEDGRETQRYLENWHISRPTVDSQEQLEHLKFDPVLSKGTLASTPVSIFHSGKNNTESDDARSSTEYMDSIRRSSDNVFARTEALANKQTSFKVMKPRQ